MTRFPASQQYRGAAAVIEDDEDENDKHPPTATTFVSRGSSHVGPPLLLSSVSYNHNDIMDSSDPMNNRVNEFFHFPCSTYQLAKQRIKFFVFLRFLMNYLKIHDATRQKVVHSVLQQFYLLSKVLVPEYQDEGSFLWDLYTKVKPLVTSDQWQVAHFYFRKFLMERQRLSIYRGRRFSRHPAGGLWICAVISSDGS